MPRKISDGGLAGAPPGPGVAAPGPGPGRERGLQHRTDQSINSADRGRNSSFQNRPGLLCTMGYPLENQGALFAEAILRACAAKKGEGSPALVGIMPGIANFPIDSLRVDKIKEVLAQHSNITVVDMPPGGYAAPSAQKATLDFLQSRKDIDVMMIFADQMIMSAILPELAEAFPWPVRISTRGPPAHSLARPR